MCLNPTYGYGWALTGFEDAKEGLPLSLTVEPWQSEPDTRRGASPTQLTGTVHISGLRAGGTYALYRWDSVDAAFDYARATSIHTGPALTRVVRPHDRGLLLISERGPALSRTAGPPPHLERGPSLAPIAVSTAPWARARAARCLRRARRLTSAMRA